MRNGVEGVYTGDMRRGYGEGSEEKRRGEKRGEWWIRGREDNVLDLVVGEMGESGEKRRGSSLVGPLVIGRR